MAPSVLGVGNGVLFIPNAPGSSAAPPITNFIIMENGVDFMLTENGADLMIRE